MGVVSRVALVSMCVAGCAAPMRSPSPPLPAVPEIVARALPGVVLILAHQADGHVRYGAGLLVGGKDQAITATHIVDGAKSLGALLYRPGRTSYTPMDGGLDRYLFENAKDVIPTVVLERDPVTDLALVRLDGDTARHPRLPLARQEPAVGEPVLAVGHPQETVWSFTAGMVSAIHQGAIQHDALVSAGSSGGPLIDRRGEVVGITTAQVTSHAPGLAFARPAQVVRALLSRRAQLVQTTGRVEPSAIDRSSPERAALSCWRAQEIGSPGYADCIDWGVQWSLHQRAVEELRRRVPAAPGEPAPCACDRDAFIRDARRLVSERLARGEIPRPDRQQKWPTSDHESARDILEEVRQLDAHREKLLRDRNGLKTDLNNPRSVQALLRRGARVEETRLVSPDLAWVRMSGRNADGTPVRFSQCWVKSDGTWIMRSPALPADLSQLPSGWPPPMDDFEYARMRTLACMLDNLS
jgi:hypothetical protein